MAWARVVKMSASFFAFARLCAWLLIASSASLAFGSDTTSVATNSALAEHLAQLRAPEGFTVVVPPPYAVSR